jgi:hypothetical protein
MRPLERDFACAPMASTAGVPRPMPTSAVWTAKKRSGCVAAIRYSAHLLAIDERRAQAALGETLK